MLNKQNWNYLCLKFHTTYYVSAVYKIVKFKSICNNKVHFFKFFISVLL